VQEKALAAYAKELEVDKLKSQADVLDFAAGLERGATNAYLGIIPSFADRALAKLAGQLAADELSTSSYSPRRSVDRCPRPLASAYESWRCTAGSERSR
jgi:Ferritin-like domain